MLPKLIKKNLFYLFSLLTISFHTQKTQNLLYNLEDLQDLFSVLPKIITFFFVPSFSFFLLSVLFCCFPLKHRTKTDIHFSRNHLTSVFKVYFLSLSFISHPIISITVFFISFIHFLKKKRNENSYN